MQQQIGNEQVLFAPRVGIDDIERLDPHQKTEAAERLFVEQLPQRLTPGKIFLKMGFLISLVGRQHGDQHRINDVVADVAPGAGVELFGPVRCNQHARKLPRRQRWRNGSAPQ